LEKKMKLKKATGTLGLAVLAAFASTAAIAADSGWYGGLSIGRSSASIDDERITSGLLGSGFTTNSISNDDSDFGWKILAGRKFNRNFAVEGGYFNLGEFGFTATTTPAGTLTGAMKVQGLNLDAVGLLPISEKFSALGRVGLTYIEAKDTFSGTGAVVVTDPNPKKSEANWKVGAGIQYDFTPALGLRAEYERYAVNDAVGNDGHVDLFSVGLVYTFGVAQKPAPRAETPPPAAVAPVAAAPAPAPKPVLVIVPVVAKTEQYCSILDIQFEINQKTVQREAEEKIDKVGIFMRKYPKTTAVIEGHSDEVGTTAANMKLSEQRAAGVVTYLVDRGNIARDRLKSVGYGETRPIADNTTEAGKRLNRRINAIIACATDIEGIAPIPARITMAMDMEFDNNSDRVRPQYREELRKVANFMKANPAVSATVEGHTSNVKGTAAQSMQLAQRRAQNVVDSMVSDFGVPRSRLSTASFGQTRRFAYNKSVEGQQENRRVNIILDFPPGK
jgi:OmpA-OmpF porin, OOP family